MSGWIKIHRGIVDWEWYTHIPTKTLFFHCLLRANHVEKKWRGKVINRGEFISSFGKLADETGLSIQQIRTAFKRLKSTHELTSVSSSQHTVFKVINYDKYQTTTSELTNEQQTSNNQSTTNKNEKKERSNTTSTQQAAVVPYQAIVEQYHKELPELPRVKALSETRKRHLKARWLSDDKRQTVDYWQRLFGYISKSDFLMGKSTEWQANFDFIIKEANFIKIIEGSYDNK